MENFLVDKPWIKRRTIVFMSDFGHQDGAVSAMHGVADSVCRDLKIEDLTHEIPQFNIWEASYRLYQAINYWAPGTVFVCVVDPGVGSNRKSIACLTKSGHIVVTPDNGTLTHVAKAVGILESREIRGEENRLKGSQKSFTFHGRDVYAYTGARLAAGEVDFEHVGPFFDCDICSLELSAPKIEGEWLTGALDIQDARYGSPWSNIPDTVAEQFGLKYGDWVYTEILYRGRVVYGYSLKFCRNFSEAGKGEALLFLNSLLNIGLAINQGNFAETYHVSTGEGWLIRLRKEAK